MEVITEKKREKKNQRSSFACIAIRVIGVCMTSTERTNEEEKRDTRRKEQSNSKEMNGLQREKIE